ncbi:YcnI family copper-binding membrane protein [Lentibacillus sp. Marseille-P4043]|uniref:YcnI family copper-binding membrane protein n=1 Tax=Lentibacillus sp. Marseille-P4043 TaxID=2040293 RepID=UPI000D0BBF21|nr:YcnI family protein [Lentibacillus sp. Marseille-P4043]
MKKRLGTFLALFAIGMFVMAPIAEAHVTVNPSESTTNAYEKYSVRIPVEKDINTTKVELQVPDGVNLVSVMPVNNWNYQLKKDDDERITSVTWTATAGGVKPNEFIEFSFIGANPSEPGEVSWKAFQTYEDGSVVEWTGPPDADEPASVTTITSGDEAAPHEENDSAATEDSQTDNDNESASDSNTNWIPIVISVLALLLALISLFRKKA